MAIQPRVLVVSRGRSGTKYSVEVFRAMGLDVGHEIDRPDGSVAACWAAPLDRQMGGFPPRPPLKDYTHVWQCVRDPLKSIASLYTAGTFLQQIYTPEAFEGGTMLGFLASSWYYWNKLCEQTMEEAALQYGAQTWRYRIEDKDWPRQAAESLHRPVPDVSKISRTLNTRKHWTEPPLPIYGAVPTWAEIQEVLAPELYTYLREMSKEYGYE